MGIFFTSLSILQSLIGNNEHSWGWDLGRNKVYHGKNPAGDTYPKTLSSDEAFVVPDKFLRKSGIFICLIKSNLDQENPGSDEISRQMDEFF